PRVAASPSRELLLFAKSPANKPNVANSDFDNGCLSSSAFEAFRSRPSALPDSHDQLSWAWRIPTLWVNEPSNACHDGVPKSKDALRRRSSEWKSYDSSSILRRRT